MLILIFMIFFAGVICVNIENLLPEWETVRVLGSGGFGKVYEIMKKEQKISDQH